MRAQWTALHADLVRKASRLSFQPTFTILRDTQAPLRPFGDPAALLDALQRGGGDPEAKNSILRALVVEAQRRDDDGATDRTALVLLYLALWPGLDAVHGRLLRHYRSEPEALTSEIAARFAQGVARLDLDRVNRIAATLIRNIERDIGRLLKARWAEAGKRCDVEEIDGVSCTWPASMLGIPLGSDPDLACRLIEAHMAAIIGADASLVSDIAVHGLDREQAARARGLSYEAGRKRYQRGLARLRESLAACPGTGPGPAFPHRRRRTVGARDGSGAHGTF